MVSHPAFWLGAVALVLWGLRYALHRGLAPESTQAGVQPLALGLPAQVVRIPAVRGLTLFAWYVPQPGPQPAPAVVLLHGWGGNASTLLPAAQTLHQAGYAVLLPEARNHGRSDRDGHSSLPRFAQDLGSALDWLALQPGIDTTRVAALGHSVGGAAVLLAASQRTDLYGAVIVSAFAHPEQVMRRWLAARHVPYWPLGWVVNRYVERVIGARFTDIAPLYTLARAQCPVLLLHGRQDNLVPVDDVRQLWQRRGSAQVRLLECEGTHEGFDDLAAVSRHILDFLRMPGEAAALAPIHESPSAVASAF